VKTITIITPANIEIEYKLAGVGARLAAFVIDFSIQLLAILLAAGIIFGTSYQLRDIPVIATRFSVALAVFMVITFVIHFGYFIVLEMVMNGQSIGKRIFGLRVICDNGQPIEFSHSLMRGVIRSTLDSMYFGLFVILFSKKHKRVGDMVAGTIVVIEKTGGGFEPTLYSPTVELPEFLPPLSEMTTTEREIVEEWLRRKADLPNDGMDIAVNLKNYFDKKTLSRL